ncbi:hypothetical protein PybrP1_009379, partial [[Pythium] brassicae (nom. inval.)]
PPSYCHAIPVQVTRSPQAELLEWSTPQKRPFKIRTVGVAKMTGATTREVLGEASLPPSPHTLNFSNAYWGDAKCAEIVAQAQRAPFPAALDLRGNRFEAAGAVALAELLRAPHNVVSINLEWNNVGLLDHGIEALAAALATDTRLLALDLRNNNVGPEGAKALAKALARNRTLRHLDLRWNDVGNAGALALREALQTNHTLVVLELVGNNSSLKHAEEIEKLLARNRAFQEQLRPAAAALEPASPGPRQEEPKELATHADDQLLLQVLAEKEAFECELATARKASQCLVQRRAWLYHFGWVLTYVYRVCLRELCGWRAVRQSERVEESEMQVQRLRKDVESLKEERNRHQQHEMDAKRESHELKMQLETLENTRKIEFDEYRASRTALERELGAMREKMSHAEALHGKSLEQKSKQIAQLEDQKYAQDSELHKLSLSVRSLEDEGNKLRRQLLDTQKEFDKREEKQASSHQGAIAAQQRQHELEVRSLTSQLSHATLQLEEHRSSAAGLKDKLESLQASALEAKISHEREVSELKKHWELDVQERIQRSMLSIEAQVAEVKNGRLHLEREVARLSDTILRLRDENTSLQQSSGDAQRGLRDELEKQFQELRARDDLLAAAEKERARSEEKLGAMTRRLEEQDARLVRLRDSYEDRIREMADAAKLHSQEAARALKEKAETIAALERRQLRLERVLDAQTREHESRLDRFADSMVGFLQAQVAAEREWRKKRCTDPGAECTGADPEAVELGEVEEPHSETEASGAT